MFGFDDEEVPYQLDATEVLTDTGPRLVFELALDGMVEITSFSQHFAPREEADRTAFGDLDPSDFDLTDEDDLKELHAIVSRFADQVRG